MVEKPDSRVVAPFKCLKKVILAEGSSVDLGPKQPFAGFSFAALRLLQSYSSKASLCFRSSKVGQDVARPLFEVCGAISEQDKSNRSRGFA